VCWKLTISVSKETQYPTHIRAHYFKHRWLDVFVSYPSDVTIPAFFVPNLKRLASNTIQDGKESALQMMKDDELEMKAARV
jgi:hypothetical protein